jgi:hypothetical protein
MHSYALEHRECTAQKRRDKQSHSPDTLASAYSLVRRTKTLHLRSYPRTFKTT